MDGSNGNGVPGESPFMRAYNRRFRAEFNQDPPENNFITTSGPKYPIEGDSFVLERGDWDALNNPNGIVPVVVSPKLVSGVNPNNESQPLKKEQVDGIEFMWKCYNDEKGGILGHEMGLGKTRSVITLIATLLEQSAGSRGKSNPGIKKAIIIVPKVAIEGWSQEFRGWRPRDIPCKIQVLEPNSKDGWDVVKKFKTNSINVLILSYESFAKYNGGSGMLGGFTQYDLGSVDLVVCDEAHFLKNKETKRVKNLKTFKGTTRFIGLTGTPYQNTIEELCSLVSLFRPDVFNDMDYKTEFCDPIMQGMKNREIPDAITEELMEHLRSVMKPALHYRFNNLKIEKREVTLCIPLHGHPDHYFPDPDEEPYSRMQHKMYQMLVETLRTAPMCGFEKLSFLHKACVHPKYLIEGIKESKNAATNMNVFREVLDHFYNIFTEADFEHPDFGVKVLLYSSKIKVVAKMIQCLNQGNRDKDESDPEKAVVVSSSTKLLSYIKKYLEHELGTNAVVYDGEKSTAERERALKSFNTNDSVQVLLLSLKTGGVALNLTRANHLILMDPDYNPANDRQALGRVYRIGQNRPVHLYRLLCTGTLEEQKYLLQLGKDEMRKYFQSDRSNANSIRNPYNEAQLMEYHHVRTTSYIRKKLDELNDSEEIDENVDAAFAEELRSSQHYSSHGPPPENLPLVQEVWEYVSYCFLMIKEPDAIQEQLLSPLFPTLIDE